jgi:hypothetical protein
LPLVCHHVCSGTLLDYAAASGSVEICEILMKNGADVNAKNIK